MSSTFYIVEFLNGYSFFTKVLLTSYVIMYLNLQFQLLQLIYIGKMHALWVWSCMQYMIHEADSLKAMASEVIVLACGGADNLIMEAPWV